MFGSPSLIATLLGASMAAAQMSRCLVPSSDRGRQQADPAFTVSENQLASRVSCTNPGGIRAARNPILLVPGTGNNATQSWQTGYRILLGREQGLGYDVCYVSPPPFMLNDIQTNAEYIANAIDTIYQVNCKPFPIMGWSQGNLATQWVFTFFPSTRRKISQFLSLAGDFRGTDEGIFVQAVRLGNTAPSVIQQSVPSRFLNALAAKGGNYNWVPTTSIFSRTDEVVQPELTSSLAGSTSFIGGTRAGNILIQDFCPNIAVGHGEELYVNFSYQVVKIALASTTRIASQNAVRTAVADGTIPCVQDDVAPGLTQNNVATLQGSFIFAGAVVIAPPITAEAEPPLRGYVATTPSNPVHD